MTGLLLSYIWGWQGAFPGHFGVVLALFAWLGAASHLSRGESAREIGLGLEQFGPALRLALAILGVPLAAILVGGVLSGTARIPSADRLAAAVGWHLFWGTAQQYGLVCFFYRRFRELLETRGSARTAAAALFALFHLPNPFLVPVSFLTGALACWIYDRAPNLWALGIAHGATGLLLTRALPRSLTAGMRVGPGFFGLSDAP